MQRILCVCFVLVVAIKAATPNDTYIQQIVQDVSLFPMLIFGVILLVMLTQGHIPGLSVAVVNERQTLYFRNFGFQDISAGRRVADNTLFMLASVSKTLVSIAAMQLVEQGRIDLEGDVNSYLKLSWKVAHPLFPSDKITVRQLMTHTAGVVDNMIYHNLLMVPNDTTFALTDFLKHYLHTSGYYFMSENWTSKRPGTNYQYSRLVVHLHFFCHAHAAFTAWVLLFLPPLLSESIKHRFRSTVSATCSVPLE